MFACPATTSRNVAEVFSPTTRMQYVNAAMRVLLFFAFRSVDIVGVPEPKRFPIQEVGAGGPGVFQHQSRGPSLQIRRQHGRGETSCDNTNVHALILFCSKEVRSREVFLKEVATVVFSYSYCIRTLRARVHLNSYLQLPCRLPPASLAAFFGFPLAAQPTELLQLSSSSPCCMQISFCWRNCRSTARPTDSAARSAEMRYAALSLNGA